MHYIQLFVLLVCTIWCSNAQQPQQCNTPDRRRGVCIDLRECPQLYNLIRQPNLSFNDRNYLRQSQCAYYSYPWVCCPNESPQPPPPGPPPTQPAPGIPYTLNDLPQPGVCGPYLSDRIIGGEETSIFEYPWMALIKYSKPNGGSGYHCGGVLIDKQYVLTASHCVNGKDLSQLKWTLSAVRLGEWNQQTNPDCDNNYGDDDRPCADPVLDIDVVQRIPHENYAPNSKAQENDIALLRLARPVDTFTEWVRPICLPVAAGVRGLNHDNSQFTVAGWGKVTSNSNIKLKVELDNVPIGQCNTVYRSQNVVLTEKQLCAGGQPRKDSCRGDSGGPLMAVHKINATRSYQYLAGVVSFGPSPCGLEGWPGVYTRVDQYIDWIVANMRKLN